MRKKDIIQYIDSEIRRLHIKLIRFNLINNNNLESWEIAGIRSALDNQMSILQKLKQDIIDNKHTKYDI